MKRERKSNKISVICRISSFKHLFFSIRFNKSITLTLDYFENHSDLQKLLFLFQIKEKKSHFFFHAVAAGYYFDCRSRRHYLFVIEIRMLVFHSYIEIHCPGICQQKRNIFIFQHVIEKMFRFFFFAKQNKEFLSNSICEQISI